MNVKPSDYRKQIEKWKKGPLSIFQKIREGGSGKGVGLNLKKKKKKKNYIIKKFIAYIDFK